MTTHDFLTELASIRRGENAAWKGDAVANAEHYIWRIRHDMPDVARAVAADIERNMTDCSDTSGLSLTYLRFVAKHLTDRISPRG